MIVQRANGSAQLIGLVPSTLTLAPDGLWPNKADMDLAHDIEDHFEVTHFGLHQSFIGLGPQGGKLFKIGPSLHLGWTKDTIGLD